MNRERSQALLERAQKVLPGGVNSPVRAYRSVGGTPPFLVRGAGSHVCCLLYTSPSPRD